MKKSKIEKRLPEPKHSKEKKADKTSVSPAIAKPNVICSQSKLYPFKTENEFLISKSKSMGLKQWVSLATSLFKNADGFYKWFDEKYKNKEFSIVAKVGNGFYIDLSQMRELYSLMSSNAKLVSPPS